MALLDTILLVFALGCFLLAATKKFDDRSPNLVALGLAFFVAVAIFF